MSSTSHNLTALKKTLQHARTEMHQHSIFHHNQSQKSSGGSPASLSALLGALQGCELVAGALCLPLLPPMLAAAVKLTKSMQAVDSNHDNCIDLIKKTTNYLDTLQAYDSCSNHDAISKLVQKHKQDFVRSLEQLKERSNEIASHGKLYDILHSSAHKASLEKINRELETATTLHFFQLAEDLAKELNTLHEDHSPQQDSSPYSHTVKEPQAYMGPKLSPNELSTPRHTKPAHDIHSGGCMRMPVPNIGGPAHNYIPAYIQLPTPEPYYPHLSQPQSYYVLS